MQFSPVDLLLNSTQLSVYEREISKEKQTSSTMEVIGQNRGLPVEEKPEDYRDTILKDNYFSMIPIFKRRPILSYID